MNLVATGFIDAGSERRQQRVTSVAGTRGCFRVSMTRNRVEGYDLTFIELEVLRQVLQRHRSGWVDVIEIELPGSQIDDGLLLCSRRR